MSNAAREEHFLFIYLSIFGRVSVCLCVRNITLFIAKIEAKLVKSKQWEEQPRERGAFGVMNVQYKIKHSMVIYLVRWKLINLNAKFCSPI